MPELLVELICEPLPLWAQNGEAPKELARRLGAGLKEKGLLGEGAPEPTIFATPLRLAFRIPDVAEHAPERTEEKRGPRVGSPDKAAMGFLRSVGLTSIEDLKPRESKDRKGKFWFVDIKVASQPADALIPEIVIEAMRQLPWQKTMRWEVNGFRWPRVLHRYLVLLDDKPLSLDSVAAALPEGIEGGKAETLDTHGNFVPVSSPKDWKMQLESRGITLSFVERCKNIESDYNKGKGDAFGMLSGMRRFPLEDTINEFASMTEAPRAVKIPLDIGIGEEKYLEYLNVFVAQVLEAELRSVFCLPMNEQEKAVLMFVAEAPPSGKGGGAQDSLPADWEASLQDAVRRVANARFADAQFYWERDKATGFDNLHESLKDMRYHLRLGSLYERSERLAHLSRFVAQQTRAVSEELGAESGYDLECYAEEAGRYAQTDLASETVREFPKLAGVISGILYLGKNAHTEHPKLPLILEAATAMFSVQRGVAPQDVEPSAMIPSLHVAEHTDALVGLWAAGERATGSSDPFAMRRHALFLYYILKHKWFKDFSLHGVIEESARLYRAHSYTEVDFSSQNLEDLKQFIFERIKYSMLEHEGVPYDILQAAIYSTVRQKEGIVSRMRESARALYNLLTEEDGKNLQAAWVRASGLAKGFASDKKFDATLGNKKEEKALFQALKRVKRSIQTEPSVEKQIRLLAKLRNPIDNFLDNVHVLKGTQAEQENRLALLRQFMDTVRLVADLDYLEGGERAAPPPSDSETSAPTDASPSAPRV